MKVWSRSVFRGICMYIKIHLYYDFNLGIIYKSALVDVGQQKELSAWRTNSHFLFFINLDQVVDKIQTCDLPIME